MKHFLFVISAALTFSTTVFSQKGLHVVHGCAYKTATEDADLYTFASSEEAEHIVSEICNAMGVSQNFDIRSANVENALATNDGPRRIILYSTVFLKKFNEDARTRWAAYSVLAHEIGHHFNGHDFGEPNPGKRKTMELEADRFSGSALRLLGANLDEAKAGIETFALQGEQAMHPSAKARTEALANGWNQMQERLAKMGAGIPTPDSNIPRERDTDGDGIPDKNDACPEEYGRPLTAGCPDGDEDGIPDSDDKCRYLKGPANWKGCPDSDGDGIPDHEDKCPKEPGYLTDGGCPLPDRDGDSVTDRADKCPDAYGLARFQGCPDTDGDGVPDLEDKCPKEKGESYRDGCPGTNNNSINHSESKVLKRLKFDQCLGIGYDHFVEKGSNFIYTGNVVQMSYTIMRKYGGVVSIGYSKTTDENTSSPSSEVYTTVSPVLGIAPGIRVINSPSDIRGYVFAGIFSNIGFVSDDSFSIFQLFLVCNFQKIGFKAAFLIGTEGAKGYGIGMQYCF
ncbi:MAG: thrombospondin type 3 repeat-containing protein [Phycisphaerae bacterium]|nr:thrombospondin type 3 repeat-containing protein [Saprospiraceae bacterium]